MDDKLINKKVEKLNRYYKKISKKNLTSIEQIHKLRTKTRELISLVSRKTPFYKKLKKIIKLSNEIRDIDVFNSVFLDSLPKKYKKLIDLKDIEKQTQSQRETDIKKLFKFLKKFDFSAYIIEKKSDPDYAVGLEKPPLIFAQKELHKYRIYIKTKLYILQNNSPSEKEKIEQYTLIKDHLGNINDNFNAQTRLEFFDIHKKDLKLIKKYIYKQNMNYFKSIEKLNNII